MEDFSECEREYASSALYWKYIPPDSFIDTFMHYSYLMFPETYRKNEFGFLCSACLLFNQATRARLLDSMSTPSNIFLALVGKPRSGKTALRSCLQAAHIETWIRMIGKGTHRGVIDDIAELSYGIIYWDEAGQLTKADYLSDVEYLFNQLYDLAHIRYRTKSSGVVELSHNSYYVSALFNLLPAQWNKLRTVFTGGFTRRILPIFFKGRVPLYQPTEFNEASVPLVIRLHDMISYLQGVLLQVKPNPMPELAEKLEKLIYDELEQSCIQDYTYRLSTALIGNYCMRFPHQIENSHFNITVSGVNSGVLPHGGKIDDYSGNHKSPQNNRSITPPHHQLPHSGVIQPLHHHTTTTPTVFVVSGGGIVCNSDVVEVSSQSHIKSTLTACRIITENQFSTPLGGVLLRHLCSNFISFPKIDDDRSLIYIERIKQLKKKVNKPVVSKSKFFREIFHSENHRIYSGYLTTFCEEERIRIVKHRLKTVTRTYVILDVKAPLCGNCDWYSEKLNICTLLYPTPEEQYNNAGRQSPSSDACDNFKLISTLELKKEKKKEKESKKKKKEV